mmetsp:Transcript_117586/g.262918  ORF Transcript_117586/g.262918 Transcript_117586/m.262918 type:complete len:209 (+) Transcript_117586:68-694(+)
MPLVNKALCGAVARPHSLEDFEVVVQSRVGAGDLLESHSAPGFLLDRALVRVRCQSLAHVSPPDLTPTQLCWPLVIEAKSAQCYLCGMRTSTTSAGSRDISRILAAAPSRALWGWCAGAGRASTINCGPAIVAGDIIRNDRQFRVRRCECRSRIDPCKHGIPNECRCKACLDNRGAELFLWSAAAQKCAKRGLQHRDESVQLHVDLLF